ncbi:MAG TPA: ABC transporter transmembrane domain-containing protein [Myxococcales bacterium]|nr:ABC transporter transmembrane domain-containing protein [Myxococcales bacterium]
MSDKPKKTATLRRLLSLARPEWRLLGWGVLCLTVGSAMSLLYPQGIRIIVDGSLSSQSMARIDRAAGLLAIVAVVQGLAVACRYILFSIAGERAVTRIREQVFQRILDQEIGFFDERRTGELTSRLSSDTTVLQGAVSSNISIGLRTAATVVGGIIFLFFTSPVLTLLMLAVVPPLAIGGVWYGRRLRKLSKEVQDALAAANEVAEEAISGIRTVRSFVAEPAEARRYRAQTQKSFALAKTRALAGGAFTGVAQAGAFCAAALVFWYGGHLVVRGEMTVGGLSAFLVYTMLVAVSLGALTDLWADFMRALGAAERVFELLDRTPSMAPLGGLVIPQVAGAIELSQVTFAYPSRKDVRVLDDVSLRLDPGEIVAVVGPSGAGKSTLAGLIARLYDPGSGRVLLDGYDLRELDVSFLRKQIGTVAQEPILFGTSIAENIRYGRPGASLDEVREAARTANAAAFIERFPEAYETLVGERGVQLSGGQKQRVAIARAVLKNPRILVLDEATSALDAESEHLVKEALERLMRGRTTLIIAHRLSTVKDAHRVLVIDGGRIVQSGNHAELLREEGLYRRLVERQFVAA